jgi:peptidoglycan/xylan/chitin deacetylase (PgdA/CDA1 family)
MTAASALRTALRPARGTLRRLTSRPGAAPVILLYHRVAEPRFDPWSLCVSPANFRAQLEMLAAERQVMPLDDLVAAISARTAPAFATAITFDDGYRDNALVAAPLLAALKLPATLFVTTGRIGAARAFWWDELVALMPRAEHDAHWRRLSALADDAREEELAQLRARAAAPSADEQALPMDAAMLAELAGSGIAIGGHARSHMPLTGLVTERRRAEIAGSRDDLAALLGRAPSGFAYPHGDFDAETARMVQEAGFDWAVAVANRAVPERADRYALPRLTVGDWSAKRLRREIRAAGG